MGPWPLVDEHSHCLPTVTRQKGAGRINTSTPSPDLLLGSHIAEQDWKAQGRGASQGPEWG